MLNPTNIENKLAISIGSRAHLEEQSVASRSFFRTVLMYGFHFLVWLFAVRGIKDTQCGFKLLTREAARICFENMHVERWYKMYIYENKFYVCNLLGRLMWSSYT